MFYCNLRVLQYTEIAVQEDFASPNMTSGGTSRGGAKKFSMLAIARHILLLPHKLWHNSTTAPDPIVGQEGCPLAPIAHLSRRLRHLDPRRLRCLELGPPTFQANVTPLAGPQASHQLNPTLILIRSPLLASHVHGNGWSWMTWNCCNFKCSLFVNEWARQWERVRWPEEPRDCWLAAVLWISLPASSVVGEVCVGICCNAYMPSQFCLSVCHMARVDQSKVRWM